MMRPCLLLAMIGLGAAQTVGPASLIPRNPDTQKVECAISSIAVADQLTNSIIFIWQGINGCGPGHNKAECSVDVSYAIQAVSNTIMMVEKAIAGCSGAVSAKTQCAASVEEVVSSMAGVAGASSAIAKNCPKASLQPVPGAAPALGMALNGGGASTEFPHGLAMCIVDAKSLFWTIIGTAAHIKNAHDQCQVAGEPCTKAVLHVTAALAQLGEFVAGVVGHCSKPENHVARCAGDVLGLLRNLDHLGHAGMGMSDACALGSAERLYLDNGSETQATVQDNRPTLALAMLLPIAAVVSFVAGRRMGKSHQALAYDAEAAEGEE